MEYLALYFFIGAVWCVVEWIFFSHHEEDQLLEAVADNLIIIIAWPLFFMATMIVLIEYAVEWIVGESDED